MKIFKVYLFFLLLFQAKQIFLADTTPSCVRTPSAYVVGESHSVIKKADSKNYITNLEEVEIDDDNAPLMFAMMNLREEKKERTVTLEEPLEEEWSLEAITQKKEEIKDKDLESDDMVSRKISDHKEQQDSLAIAGEARTDASGSDEKDNSLSVSGHRLTIVKKKKEISYPKREKNVANRQIKLAAGGGDVTQVCPFHGKKTGDTPHSGNISTPNIRVPKEKKSKGHSKLSIK